MLVLSRSEEQGITFPGIGVSIRILEVGGSKVKVGIDAPIEVRVLRDELLERNYESSSGQHCQRLPRASQHELLHALNEIKLGLRVYLKQIEGEGSHDVAEQRDAKAMLHAMLTRLEIAGGRTDDESECAQDARPIDEHVRTAVASTLVVRDDANESYSQSSCDCATIESTR